MIFPPWGLTARSNDKMGQILNNKNYFLIQQIRNKEKIVQFRSQGLRARPNSPSSKHVFNPEKYSLLSK